MRRKGSSSSSSSPSSSIGCIELAMPARSSSSPSRCLTSALMHRAPSALAASPLTWLATMFAVVEWSMDADAETHERWWRREVPPG